jgi:hypothetical protein
MGATAIAWPAAISVHCDTELLKLDDSPSSVNVAEGSPPPYAFDEEFTGDLSLWTDHGSGQEPPGYWMEHSAGWAPLPASDWGLATIANGILSLKTSFLNHPDGAVICGVELSTRHSFATFVHGSIDGRFQIPGNAQGWSAFWLLGNGEWPASGEIDIFEFVNNGSQNGIPFFSVHWAATTAGAGGHNTWTYQWPARVPNYTIGWHSWHVERSSDYIKVWIDGTLWSQVLRSDLSPMGGNFDVIFDEPMFIRLDTKSGANALGSWAYDPNNAATEGAFQVDYVRVRSAAP